MIAVVCNHAQLGSRGTFRSITAQTGRGASHLPVGAQGVLLLTVVRARDAGGWSVRVSTVYAVREGRDWRCSADEVSGWYRPLQASPAIDRKRGTALIPGNHPDVARLVCTDVCCGAVVSAGVVCRLQATDGRGRGRSSSSREHRVTGAAAEARSLRLSQPQEATRMRQQPRRSPS